MKKIVLWEECFWQEDMLNQANKIINLLVLNNKLPSKYKNKLLLLREDILNNKKINIDIFKKNHNLWFNLLDLNNKHTWLDNFHHWLRITLFHKLLNEIINYNDYYNEYKNNNLINILTNWNSNILIENIIFKMLWWNKFDAIPWKIWKSKILLTNHSKKLLENINNKKYKNIIIVWDNAWEELFYDLLFSVTLLSNNLVENISYHYKNYPYNITDTTFTDIKFFIKNIKNFEKHVDFSNKLDYFIKNWKIEFKTYIYSTIWYEIKNSLNKYYFKNSDLVIFKWDFNFRKLVWWYYWDINDDIKSILSYFSKDLCIFRVIKNEILIWVENKQILNKLNAENQNWWKEWIAWCLTLIEK